VRLAVPTIGRQLAAERARAASPHRLRSDRLLPDDEEEAEMQIDTEIETAFAPVPLACRLVDGVAATPAKDDFAAMLDSLDERVQAFVVDDRYACSLSPEQWAALNAATERNGIPLVLEARIGRATPAA
jgi:hypothetical protein